jgi:CubicO group peptidase (beta-lactamase class C family)
VGVAVRARALATVVVVLATAGCGGQRARSVHGGTPPAARTVEATGRWPISTPAAEAMVPALLRRADALVRHRFPSVIALLAARHGRIVFERYYDPYDRPTPLDLFSMTASVTSAALGIAIADGKIRSVDVPLAHLFPRALASASDARVRRITLRRLLTMTSGFPADEPTQATPMFTHYASPLRALLARPLTGPPGRFAYDSGSPQLVGDAVAKAEGMSEARLVRARLFGPLGIVDDKSWPTDGDGNTWGFAGLRLTARDLAKLGELYLRSGRWNGKQLVPAEWVRDSTARHLRFAAGEGYGYFWGRGRDWGANWFGTFAGTQSLLVVPGRDLVVVIGSVRGAGPDVAPIVRLVVDAAR